MTLACGHSQSVNAAEVVGYIGNGEMLTSAVVEWSMAYADLSERDDHAFLATT